MNKTATRLNKYISESGICSRREADRYIEKGNVLLNGKRAKIGDLVIKGDRVMVNGNMIEPKKDDESILIAFNKPVGVVSTTDLNTTDNIVRYVNHSERIFPVGRLDKDSQGLIFLTSNGDIVNKILRAGNQHEKEYLVTVNKPITDEFIAAMSAGVPVLGGTTKKCFVKKETPFIFRIILIQGMNRQIRRMCEYFDYEVTKLERIRIMNVNLKGLPVGEWRELTPDEIAGINKMIENSSSTDERKNKSSKSNDARHKKSSSAEIDFGKTDWKPKKNARQHTGNKSFHPAKRKSKSSSSGKTSGYASGRNAGRRGRSR